MTRVAAFDCGTNSLRLLVVDLDPVTGDAHELVRELRIVRLGEGVDHTGRISEASLQRTFAALDEYAELLALHRPDRVRFCATSAARDAENSADFVHAVRERIGIEPEVLAGAEEARASFAGATRSLGQAPGPCLVFDIGGGSTELILGSPDGSVQQAVSLDVGSVRLTERLLAADPPTQAQVDAVSAEVDRLLDGCPVDPALAATVLGVAGTVTTVAAGVLGLDSYQRDRIHHSELAITDVRRTVRELVAMSTDARRALGYMHPGRADVIGAGALILDRVLARASVSSMIVSESDILDGIAWSCVK